MTRQSKTPQQRAEEALAVAQRRVAKAERAVAATHAAWEAAKTVLDEAVVRLDYAAEDPALPTPVDQDEGEALAAPTEADET
jgi:hypothetical protein